MFVAPHVAVAAAAVAYFRKEERGLRRAATQLCRAPPAARGTAPVGRKKQSWAYFAGVHHLDVSGSLPRSAGRRSGAMRSSSLIIGQRDGVVRSKSGGLCECVHTWFD